MMPSIVLICGVPGAGKTTLAEAIGRQMACPVFDIDKDFRSKLGPVDTTVDTHSGRNKAIGRVGHQMFFLALEFWAKYRPGQPVIFAVPMLAPRRQAMLQDFVDEYPDSTMIIEVVWTGDATDEAIQKRMDERVASGYVGGVDTVKEYRRVKSTAVPIPLKHHVIDTVNPLDVCIEQAFECIRSGAIGEV